VAAKRKPLILVFSATAGAGHVRAADALVEAQRYYDMPLEIKHHDILDFTFPLFKKLYSEFYFAVAKASPDLWGYLYRKAGHEQSGKPKSAILKLFDHFNYKKYFETIEHYRPDALLCTHFLPYAGISGRRHALLNIPIFSVPTDYDVHTLWISNNVSKFYTATEETAWTLSSRGIPQRNIAVTGIPVMPQFAETTSQPAARKALGLSPERFTVMILSGGYGIGIIDKLVPAVASFLSEMNAKSQLIVVCGKNKRLYDKLKRMKATEKVAVTLYQYVSFIDKLMESADVLITKSGGLTVSEALVKHLPMIIFDPIPGQEGRNADYLTEHGTAVLASNLIQLHYKLKQVIDEPGILASMRRKAKSIARPNAAREILEDIGRIIRPNTGR